MMKKFFVFLLGFALSKLYSFEFSHNICNLWSDSSGTAILYNWNLNNYLPVKKHKFFAGANLFYLDSSVEYFKGSAFKGDFCAEYANDFFGISADFGFVSAGSLSVAAEHIFTQEEICGFNGKIAVPFYIKEFSVKPYFGFFSGKSEKGDFYWFYGNVKNPFSGAYGIQFSFMNHHLDFCFCAGKIHVLNNENKMLVDAAGNLFICTYSQLWKSARWKFKPYTGAAFFYGDFNGSLTDKNQAYFLYPYKYYRVNGAIEALALLNGFSFEYKKCAFSFLMDFNSLFFAFQSGKYDADWKYKKNILFGGGSGKDSSNIDFFNLAGLVSADFKAKYNIPFDFADLNVFLSKNCVVPFKVSTKKSSGAGNSASSRNDVFSKVVLPWIFSGITIGFNLNI